MSNNPNLPQLHLGRVSRQGNETYAVTTAMGSITSSGTREKTRQGPTPSSRRGRSQHGSWLGPIFLSTTVSISTLHDDRWSQQQSVLHGKALQVLKILRTAGARPTISVFYHEFLLQLKMKNPTLRKQRDKILKNAMQEATQVLSLKGLSRASIVGQLRKNTDGHSIYRAMENLLQSERLPRELEKFLKFENVLDRPTWFLPPPIH